MKASAGRSRITPFSNSPTALGACVALARPKPSNGRRMPTKTTSPSWISRGVAHVLQVGRPVREVEHPFAEPGLEPLHHSGEAVVAKKGLEVAAPVALHRRGKGATR